MAVKLTQLSNELRNRSNQVDRVVKRNLGNRSDFRLWEAAFSNNRNVGRATGEERGGFVALTPSIQPTLQYAFDRPPTVTVRADGERIYEEFPEYLGEEIPENIRLGIATYDDDSWIEQANFEDWPTFDADPEEANLQPLEEIVTADYSVATTSVLETIFEGAYSRQEIVNELTFESARQDVQDYVLEAVDTFNMVTPETPEDALSPIGQIQALLEERKKENEEETEEFLRDFNLSTFFTNVGIFGGFLGDIENAVSSFTQTFNDIQTTISQVVPDISGSIIDDVARSIDSGIRETIQEATGGFVDDNTLQQILKPLVNNDLQSAANIISELPDGLTDIGQITVILERIDLDPSNLIEGFSQSPDSNTREIVNDSRGWNGANTRVSSTAQNEELQPRATNTSSVVEDESYSFDYVDTAEEFEAEVAASSRDLLTVVIHFVEAPAGTDPDTNTIHDLHSRGGFDGVQYHYIIRRSGRVQRARPINESGVSGDGVIDIAFVGSTGVVSGENFNGILDESTNVAQQRSWREMMTAFFRIVPGGDVELAETFNAEPINPDARDPRGRDQIPDNPAVGQENSFQRPGAAGFDPGLVTNCIHGRGGGVVNRPNGNNSGGYSGGNAIQPYTGPGVSTNNTVRGNTNNVDNRLLQVFEQSLAGVGLSANCSSGYRPIVDFQTGTDTAGSTSGRHQGFAMDVQLYSGDTILSILVPEQLALIQEFLRTYVSNCAGRGYTPGFGVMSTSRRYMGPSTFHFDIARTLETGARVNLGGGTNYWVRPIRPWVVQIFDEAGITATGRVRGPSGAVSMNTLRNASGGVIAS